MSNILAGLTHSRTTRVSRGTCNNVDFVILFLGSMQPKLGNNNGMARVKHIYAALAKFRGGFLSSNGQYGPATYLFDAGYGYISKSYSDLSPAVYFGYGACWGTQGTRCTYWYRVSRGVYALNANGMLRLAKVLAS